MKKFIVISLMVLALLLMFLACTDERPIVDTTAETTDAANTPPESTETDPTETDPTETDPTETDPAETDPAETDPVETDPVETDPVETEPVETDSAMDNHNFTLNVSDNFPGSSDRISLKDSNIAIHFEVLYGTGDTSTAVAAKKDTGDIYAIWNFNSISIKPNGQYAFSVNNIEFNADFGLASVFVRAIRNASPEKQFYGPDGGDATGSSHGGAGIWLAIADIDGQLTLRINIKSYENGTYKSNIFLVPVDGRNLTVADNGSVVTLIVNDKVAATIAISGTKDFGIDGVTAGEAAENVTITLADGTVAEVANAIVAASCDTGNSVGVATRGGTIKFTSISLKPYDTVAIPADET